MNGERAIEPVISLMASALLARLMKLLLAVVGRPGLPLQIVRLDRLAEADVRFGDENIDGLHLHDRLGRRRLVTGPAGEICGNAAGADGDGQDCNACGIHYASLSTLRCDASAAVKGVDQLFVKAWLMRRV